MLGLFRVETASRRSASDTGSRNGTDICAASRNRRLLALYSASCGPHDQHNPSRALRRKRREARRTGARLQDITRFAASYSRTYPVAIALKAHRSAMTWTSVLTVQVTSRIHGVPIRRYTARKKAVTSKPRR
jgi:hypothetical protein